MSSTPRARPPIWGALLAVFWVLFTVFVTRTLFFFPGLPRDTSFGPIVASGLADLAIWLLFVWPIVRVSRRFRLDAGRWVSGIPLHFAFALVLVTLHATLRVALGRLPAIPDTSMASALYGQAQSNFLTYWVVVGAAHLVDYYQRYRERSGRAAQLEKEAAQLEAKLTRAQLDALHMQLQPHFLFNTMNTISAFLHEDPDRAERMLGRLSGMLRTVLEAAQHSEVPLATELEFIDRYLDIQQERLGGRLEISREIEPASLHAFVPALILLPLVENAIQHGVATRIDGGRITLSAALQQDSLVLRVVDEGHGSRQSVQSGHGIGLANTRARLQQLYSDAQALEIEQEGQSRFIVTVRIPYSEAAAT